MNGFRSQNRESMLLSYRVRNLGISFSEYLFCIFLLLGTSGRYEIQLQSVSINLSIIIGFMLVIALVLYLSMNKIDYQRLKYGIFILLFFLFEVISRIWTSSSDYSSEKILLSFLYLVVPYLFCNQVISRDTKKLDSLLQLFVFSGLIVSSFTLFTYFRGGSDQEVGFAGSTYLGVARAVGLSTLISFSSLIYRRGNKIQWLQYLSIGFGLMTLAVAGSRGPLINLVLAAFLPILAQIKFKNGKFILNLTYLRLLGVLFIVMISSFLFLGEESRTLQRFEVIFSEQDGGYSVATRSHFYEDSLRIGLENPVFGFGIGSWPIEMGLTDTRLYPHNFFLETFVELGIFGILLYVAFIIHSFSFFFSRKRRFEFNYRTFGVVTIFLFAFFNTFISGDVPEAHTSVSALGLLLYVFNE